MALDAVKQAFNNTLDLDGSRAEPSKSKALLHELQLGEQLNESVHQARRADFSLMLAMLCDDVREQSQFVLPHHEVDEKTLNTNVLRKRFDLPEQAPLALQKLEQINAFNQARDIKENNIENIHLTDALQPKALAFRDDAQHIASNIMGNTTLVCQAKHAEHKTDAVLNKRLVMDAEGWLKNIQMSLVKSSLLVDTAA
ncbi:MAG: VC2046/SO_2500 family protein [Colwellia sp.]|nr:VC2046/SO_2500 family protein [Colwellia sp.]MCW9083205.1 VC2046/SO_2500 family protein [Colwellia sp.]